MIYGQGAAVGYSPQQVRAMSMWQYFSALHGYIDANSPKDGNKLTDSEAEELFEWIERDSDGPRVLSTQTYWWDGEWPEPAGVVTFEV